MSNRSDERYWKGVQHCRIRADVTNSIAWRVLSNAAKALYLDLRAKLRTGSNGDIACTLKQMKHHGWASPGTLAKALYELQALGFLIVTRRGGVERGSKVCNLYAFTDLPVVRMDKIGVGAIRESFAYRSFMSVQEAEAALLSGVASLRFESKQRKQKKTTLQKLNK